MIPLNADVAHNTQKTNVNVFTDGDHMKGQ